MRRVGLSILVALLVACSETSPTAPSPHSPSPLTTLPNRAPVTLADCLRAAPLPACFSSPLGAMSVGVVGAALLAAPTNLAASASGSTVTLTWDASPGATGYIIDAGSAPGLSNLASVPTGSGLTMIQAPGIAAGTYYVRVRAQSVTEVSGPSNEAVLVVGGGGPGPCAAPGTPMGLTLVSNSGGTIVLNWTAASGNVTSYVLEAGSQSGLSDVANSDLGSAATTFTRAGIGTVFFYARVRARNACGTGAPSNEVLVNTTSTVPTAPPLPPPPGFPTVTAVTPNFGPSAGGTFVTITGTGFLTGLTIRFNNEAQSPTNVQVVNSTTITAITPPSALTNFTYAAGIYLVNPDGRNAFTPNLFTYVGSTSPAPPPGPAPPPTPPPAPVPPPPSACTLSGCSSSRFTYSCSTPSYTTSSNFCIVSGRVGPPSSTRFVFTNGRTVTCTYSCTTRTGRCTDDTGASCSF